MNGIWPSFKLVLFAVLATTTNGFCDPEPISVTDILQKAEAADWSRVPYRARFRVISKDPGTGKIFAEAKNSVLADGSRYKQEQTLKLFRNDSVDESFSARVNTGKDLVRIFQKITNGRKIDSTIRIYPEDDPQEVEGRQHSLTGRWTLSSIMTSDNEPFYVLFRRSMDKVRAAEVKTGGRILLELTAAIPEGNYLVRLDPSLGYRLVYSKTEKRHKDGHFIANNEIAPEDREPKDPSYRFEGETSIIEVRYESVGGRITPKSGSFHYTSDQSNWPKGSAANKIEFEADVLEFEYLDAPLSDDALKAEWPEAAIVYDYVKGTKQNPFLRVFEEGELRDMNPPKVGEKAPIFEVSDFEGKRVSLDQFRGEYVFVHLWATWCSACVHEIPAIERDWNSFKDKNVVFIGVSLDEDTEKLKRYVEEKKLSHLQLVDSGGWSAKIMRQYGAILLPTCLLIDPDGVLIANKSGYMMGVRKDLLNVLGVKPGTP